MRPRKGQTVVFQGRSRREPLTATPNRALTNPRVPKNSTEPAQTTYVQPPLLALFRSRATNFLFNAVILPSMNQRRLRLGAAPFLPETFSAAAARMSAFRAGAWIFSPS